MIDVVWLHPDGREQRVRRVSPLQTKRGAMQHEHQIRSALLAGTFGRKEVVEPPRLAEFADEFLSNYASVHNKASEVSNKESILRVHLVPRFGRLRLSEINTHRIDRFKADKLRAGMSKKRLNNVLAVLHTLLAVGQRWEKLDRVPPAGLLKTEKGKFDFLDFEEAERLVAGADPDDRTLILTALRTGMRIGEIRALRWENVDLVARRIYVRQSVWKNQVGTPKSGRDRVIPISDALLEALRTHRHLRGPYVFCRERGAMMTKEQFKHPLWRACRRAGLRRIGWHALRHTFASHLVMRGVPLKVVQELLGHTTIQMTMRYSHLAEGVTSEAVNLLDDPAPVYRKASGMAASDEAVAGDVGEGERAPTEQANGNGTAIGVVPSSKCGEPN